MPPKQNQDPNQNINPQNTPAGSGQSQQVPQVPKQPVGNNVNPGPQGVSPVQNQQNVPPTVPQPNQNFEGQKVPSGGSNSNKVVIIIIVVIAVLLIGGYVATRLIMGGISTGLKSGIELLDTGSGGDIDIKKEKAAVKIKAEDFFTNWESKDAESIYSSLNSESKKRTSVQDINNFFEIGGVELVSHKIGTPDLLEASSGIIPEEGKSKRHVAMFQTDVTQSGSLFGGKKTAWKERDLIFTFKPTKEKDGILSGEWLLELSLIPYKTFLVGEKISYQNLEGAAYQNRGTVSRDIKVGAVYRKNIVLSYADKFVVDLPGNDELSKKFYFYSIGNSVITDEVDSKYTRINTGPSMSDDVKEFHDEDGFEKNHYEEYKTDGAYWPEDTEELVSKFEMSVLNIPSKEEAVIEVK